MTGFDTPVVDGTGLGLPLTKALVELHGGSLDLQSKMGTGTTVTVRFPAWRIVAKVQMKELDPNPRIREQSRL